MCIEPPVIYHPVNDWMVCHYFVVNLRTLVGSKEETETIVSQLSVLVVILITEGAFSMLFNMGAAFI